MWWLSRPWRMARRLRRSRIPVPDGSSEISYAGGNGESVEDAVVIRGAESDLQGAYFVFFWITVVYGRGWSLICQSHGRLDGKDIDTLEIELRTGAKRTLYFDVTDHFAKLEPRMRPDVP